MFRFLLFLNQKRKFEKNVNVVKFIVILGGLFEMELLNFRPFFSDTVLFTVLKLV